MPAAARASATAMRSGAVWASASWPRNDQSRLPAVSAAQRQDIGALVHQLGVVGTGLVPLEHGEFGLVEIPQLAVPVAAGERKDFRLAGGQEFFAGKLGRRVQIKRGAGSWYCIERGLERVQMGFVARGDLQSRCFDLDVTLVFEIFADRPFELPTEDEACAPVTVALR